MFGEVPEHIKRRHQVETPKLGSLDSLVLPAPAIHYAEPEILPASTTRDAVLDSSAKLDSLTQKALEFYDELLSEPMSTDDMKLLSAQADAAYREAIRRKDAAQAAAVQKVEIIAMPTRETTTRIERDSKDNIIKTIQTEQDAEQE